MRTSNRTSLRRPRTNTEPTSRILLWAGVVAILLAGSLWGASTMFNGVPGRDYGKLYVSAQELGNIATHDSVSIVGVRVGQVVKSDIGADGRARLELQLEPGVRVPADSKVRIRANGLLGARYVELIPGKSNQDLSRSGTLRAEDNALTYGVPEALDTFDEPTRKRLADMVGGLGQGLLGQGIELNETGRRVGREVDNANAFLKTFNSQPEVTERLVPDLAEATRVLAEEKRPIAKLFAPTAQGVTPLMDERSAVQDSLDRAPSTLTSAGDELERARRLLSSLRSLSTATRSTLAAAPGGLRASVKLLDEARTPVARTQSLLRSASRTVSPVLKVTKALDPVLKPVTQGVGSLTPVVTTLGQYGCDIQNFATTWRSMTGYGGPGEGPAGPAMAFRLQITPPAVGEALGVADAKSIKDPYSQPCKYAPSVYPNVVTFPEAK